MWVRIIEFGRDNTPRYQYGINTSDIGDKSRCDQREVICSGNILRQFAQERTVERIGCKGRNRWYQKWNKDDWFYHGELVFIW